MLDAVLKLLVAGRRYTKPKFIGQGAYGCVIAATDTVTKQQAQNAVQLRLVIVIMQVAIKKIIDIQEMDNIDAMRTLREIKICRHLTGMAKHFALLTSSHRA